MARWPKKEEPKEQFDAKETVETDAVVPEPTKVEKSERPTSPESPDAKRYRILRDSKFVVGGAIYTIKAGDVISRMTHDVDTILPQLQTEEA